MKPDNIVKLSVGFGNSMQEFEIPRKNIIAILEPNEVEVSKKGRDAVLAALQEPIGTPRLRDMVRLGQKIAIITSDITRPVPSYKILPHLLKELWYASVNPDDVTVVFALGVHRGHTESEQRKLVGEEVFSKVSCIDSDCGGFIRMGTTQRGTPVDIARVVAHADIRIGVANIEYHYFAGYSGGAKSLMPGVSTREAVQSNHSLMALPEASAGRLDDNPVRRDLEDALNYCPLHFIVNVVMDEQKEIVCAVAGDAIKAHRRGCAFLDKLYLKRIKCRADIVIASQGGYPKDLNLYQTQKALENAKHAVKKGGIIILVGSCHEGLGESVFEDWIKAAKTPESLITRIQEDFQLGGHKAAAIALALQNSSIKLVSRMEPDFVKILFLEPYADLQSALNDAFLELGEDATVLIMPYGGSTLPME